MDAFETIALQALADKMTACQNEGKIGMFLDKTGNVGTFMNYQNVNWCESAKDTVKIAMGSKTQEDALEEYRAAIVKSIRWEGKISFNIGKAVPKFNAEWKTDNFPSDVIFDLPKLKTEGWKTILKDSEHFDKMSDGQPEKKNFFCGAENKFTIYVVSEATDEDFQAQLAAMPCKDAYNVYIVQ